MVNGDDLIDVIFEMLVRGWSGMKGCTQLKTRCSEIFEVLSVHTDNKALAVRYLDRERERQDTDYMDHGVIFFIFMSMKVLMKMNT
jgi:hypothetical protein